MSSATSAMVALDHSRQQVSSLTDAVEHEQRLRWANQDIASWLLAESREILRRYISRMVDAEDALRDIRSVVAPYLNRSDDDERKALALGQ
jgi:hypothetical protein